MSINISEISNLFEAVPSAVGVIESYAGILTTFSANSDSCESTRYPAHEPDTVHHDAR
jgi:hypothetical protein